MATFLVKKHTITSSWTGKCRCSFVNASRTDTNLKHNLLLKGSFARQVFPNYMLPNYHICPKYLDCSSF